MKLGFVNALLFGLLVLGKCHGEILTQKSEQADPLQAKAGLGQNDAAPPRKLRVLPQKAQARKLNADAVAGIEFELNNQAERMQNYRRITYDLKTYEDEYTACITEIAPELYSPDAVDGCTGRDMIKVALDIKYVTMRTMSKMDTKIKKIFIRECFEPNLENEIVSTGCDLMERDALNLMWTGLNFYQILEANKQKYLFEYSKMPLNLFNALLDKLTNIGGEFFELINEIDNHKEVTILRLKTLIDDRFRLQKEDNERDADFVAPKTTHVFEVVESAPYEAPAFQIENQHISQFNTEGGYELAEGERKLGSTASKFDQNERHSSRRIFNTNPKYAGLHGHVADTRVFSQSKFPKNQALRMSLVSRLSAADRAQGQVPFKNIHTSHYSH